MLEVGVWPKISRIEGHTFFSNLLTGDSIVFDLGANKGGFSYELSRQIGCSIVAVEPTPDLAVQISLRAEATVVTAAISTSVGTAAFIVDRGNSEASRMQMGAQQAHSHETIAVETTTLEALFQDREYIDLVKMDIEGAEVDVIVAAAEDLLLRIGQLSIEFHDFDQTSGVTASGVNKVVDKLTKIGFSKLKFSYWTNGDVLFINRRLMRIGVIRRNFLFISAVVLPGILRTAYRSYDSAITKLEGLKLFRKQNNKL